MAGPALEVHLPRAWLTDDPDGLLGALIRLMNAELGRSYAEILDSARQRDPTCCDPEFLPVIARSRGWPLDVSLPVPLQRKIVANLAAMYRRKGTAPGIVEALRLVLGIEVRVTAMRGGAWRLGHSPLGGIHVEYTATGGESEIDLSTVGDGGSAWQHTPDMPGLTVRRNGVPLGRWQYLMPGPTRLRFVARGARLFATAPFATELELPFHYTAGGDHLTVWADGVFLARGVGWTEGAGTSPNTINFPAPLPVPTEVIVRSNEVQDHLATGDVIDAITTEGNRLLTPTRAAPPTNDAAGLVRLRIELPRALTLDENRAAAQLVDMMKSSVAVPELYPLGTPRPAWRLGTSRLGLDTRAGAGPVPP